jgi:integrase
VVVRILDWSGGTDARRRGIRCAGPPASQRRCAPCLALCLRTTAGHRATTATTGEWTTLICRAPALFGRIGARAKMPFPTHPHMLRHGCGYALANAGHDTRALQAWLGHKNIQHTVRYTELAPDRFKDFWR